MNDDEWSAVQYQFDESVDLLKAFEQAAIEHLEVSNQRTIVIYSHTIFDLEVDTGSLADAQSVSVEVFDVSSDCSIENAVREYDHSVLASFLMLLSANRRTISRNWRYQNRERRAESCVRLTVE